MPSKKDSHLAIRRLVFYSMIVVPFIPFLVALLTGYYYFSNALEKNTISLMKRIAGDHRLMIESFLNERKSNLEFLSDAFPDHTVSGHPEKFHVFFEKFKKTYPAFDDLGLIDKTGHHIAYEGPYDLADINYSDETWFSEVMEKGHYTSDIFMGYRNTPHFIIALKKNDGENICILRATIDMSAFNDLVANVRTGEAVEAYIVNPEGILQTDSQSVGKIMEKVTGPFFFPDLPDRVEIRNIHTEAGEFLYAATWMKEGRWLLVIRQNEKVAFKSLRNMVFWALVIAIVGGMVILFTADSLTRLIYLKITRLDSEKNAVENQLIRAGQLSEIGQMAAGFAHEINNPLQIISSEQALIKMLLSSAKERGEIRDSQEIEDIYESLDQIRIQIGRSAKITQSILKFARQKEPEISFVDIKALIEEIVGLVEKKAQVSGIEISVYIQKNLPEVCVDPGQMQQVILNLLNNAMDAILSHHGISGGKIEVDAGKSGNGNEILISIEDNGEGICEENMTRIFAPFFTTKPPGKGTGLGLSVCYGIIKNMGGSLECTSKRGMGTTFGIRLPLR